MAIRLPAAKVHPAGGATLRTGADEDHPIVRGSEQESHRRMLVRYG